MERHTHAHDGDLVVFHIGMTIRKPHRPDQWLPVLTAMPAMLAELARNKAEAARGEAADLGFLGAEPLLGGKGPWKPGLNGMSPDAENDKMKKYLAGNFTGKGEGGGGATFE